ncbi:MULTISPECIES: hypothetical protein [Hymenobacter]|nr:hypothetical protein [Hymenobacter sp. BT559]
MVAYGVDQHFLDACDAALADVLTACRFLTPSLMGIALLYTIGRGFISGNGLAMDWGPIIKATWIFFLLFFYQSLLDTLSAGIAGFTGVLASHPSAAAALNDFHGAAVNSQAGTGAVSEGDVVTQAPDMLADIKGFFDSFSIQGILTRLFTGAVVLVVQQIMKFLQQFILGFLYICGPISLTLSVIPAFGQLGLKWLQNFLAVQLWSLTFVLLDTLYSFYASSMSGAATGGAAGDADLFTITSAAFILMYVMVPYLTSLFIGSSAAQGFAGSMVGMVTGVASAAAGVQAGMAGRGHGVSGAIGRAMGGGGSGSGGSSSGGGLAPGGSSAGSGGGTEPSGSSASAGLPSITMSEAMNPSYRQRASGIWTY